MRARDTASLSFRRASAIAAPVLLALAFPVRADAREPVDVLIRGGTVVTMDAGGRTFERGAVAVRAERIVAVGTDADVAARYRAKRTLDAWGKVVMPGLVNTHGHAPMVLFRGLADDRPLMEWLQQFIFPAEARNVNEDFVRWGTRLACLEMIQSGTTTFVDFYFFENAAAEETFGPGCARFSAERCSISRRPTPGPGPKGWPPPRRPSAGGRTTLS